MSMHVDVIFVLLLLVFYDEVAAATPSWVALRAFLMINFHLTA